MFTSVLIECYSIRGERAVVGGSGEGGREELEVNLEAWDDPYATHFHGCLHPIAQEQLNECGE